MKKKENLSTISLRIVDSSQSFKLEYAIVIIIYRREKHIYCYINDRYILLKMV